MSNDISKRIVLTVAGILAVWGLLVGLAVRPLLSSVEGLAAQIQKNKLESAKMSAEIAGYEAMSAELEKVSQEKALLEKAFPIREDMVSLVAGLEAALSRAGVSHQLTLIDEKEDRDAKTDPPLVPELSRITEIPYILEGVGSYETLLKFFVYLENSPFFSEVSGFKLTALSAQNEATKEIRNTGLGSMNLKGVFFIRSQ